MKLGVVNRGTRCISEERPVSRGARRRKRTGATTRSSVRPPAPDCVHVRFAIKSSSLGNRSCRGSRLSGSDAFLRLFPASSALRFPFRKANYNLHRPRIKYRSSLGKFSECKASCQPRFDISKTNVIRSFQIVASKSNEMMSSNAKLRNLFSRDKRKSKCNKN